MLFGSYSDEKKKALKEAGPVPVVDPEKVYTKAEAEELWNAQYDHLETYLNALRRMVNSGRSEYSRNRNAECPKCGSNEVNDRIKRIQGEGESSFSGSFMFGCGSISGSGSSSIDTNEVNKCNKCEHEWKKHDYEWESERDMFEDMVFYPNFYYRKWLEKDDEPKEHKASWRKTKKEEDDDAEKFITEANDRLLGYCKEVIRSYAVEEFKYKDYERKRFVKMTSMPDENWKAWGGTVVKLERPVAVSFWDSLKNMFKIGKKENA